MAGSGWKGRNWPNLLRVEGREITCAVGSSGRLRGDLQNDVPDGACAAGSREGTDDEARSSSARQHWEIARFHAKAAYRFAARAVALTLKGTGAQARQDSHAPSDSSSKENGFIW